VTTLSYTSGTKFDFGEMPFLAIRTRVWTSPVQQRNNSDQLLTPGKVQTGKSDSAAGSANKVELTSVDDCQSSRHRLEIQSSCLYMSFCTMACGIFKRSGGIAH